MIKFLIVLIQFNFLFISIGQSKIIKVPFDCQKIQGAIDTACQGDTVFVFAGRYTESIQMKQGIFLIGENAETTIIEGTGKSHVINTSNNCYIHGFTIKNSGPMFVGITCDSTSPHITGNIIIKNGAGIRLINSSAVLENNLIAENDDGSDYGTTGIYCFFSNPVIKNNSIINNYARYAILLDNSSPDISFNIICNNLGGIGCFQSSAPKFFMNNVWGNEDTGNYRDCAPDSNSISVDPLFQNISKGHYKLSPKSPCLNKNERIGAPDYIIKL